MPHISWFAYAVFATICFGIGGAIHKIPAQRGQNFFVASVWSVVIPLFLCLGFFWRSLGHPSGSLLLVSALFGLFFSTSRYIYFEIFRHADTNFVTPLTATIQLLLTTALGIFFFHDQVSIYQILGVTLAVGVVFAFMKRKAGFSYPPIVGWLILVVTFSSIGYKIFQKIGASSFNLEAFLTYQFAFSSLFLLLLFAFSHRNEISKWHRHLAGSGATVGFMMGILSFLGGYAYNAALAVGPFSLINAIYAMYILVTITLGYFLFKEELTVKKSILIGLAILAIVLIRIG